MMGKHFDVFEKVKEKKKKSFGLDNILDQRREKAMKLYNFEHIPASAFERLSGYPEYLDLRRGLYICDSKLSVDKLIEEASQDLDIFVYQNSNGFMGSMSWYMAKQFTDWMGGKMMTLAEWFCIEDHLTKDIKSDDPKHKDLFLDFYDGHTEWLDTIILDKNELVINAVAEHYDLHGGDRLKVSYPEGNWLFQKGSVNPRTGLPLSTATYGTYKFHHPKEMLSAGMVEADFKKKPLINFSWTPYISHSNLGIRLCYFPDDLENSGGDGI